MACCVPADNCVELDLFAVNDRKHILWTVLQLCLIDYHGGSTAFPWPPVALSSSFLMLGNPQKHPTFLRSAPETSVKLQGVHGRLRR